MEELNIDQNDINHACEVLADRVNQGKISLKYLTQQQTKFRKTKGKANGN